MACKIADNFALSNLRKDLGIRSSCHSMRDHCLLSLNKRTGGKAMGIPGAAIGYCQALFNQVGNAEDTTRALITHLEEINMPWSRSHEMYYGFKNSQNLSGFIEGGVKPLLSGGRMPILITPLNPTRNSDELHSILSSNINIYPDETSLVRIVLTENDDPKVISNLIESILISCRETSSMPRWWPLLQGNISAAKWRDIRKELGSSWKYTNIAVNPFTPLEVIKEVFDQITVAQVAIGEGKDIHSNGLICLNNEMPMTLGLERLDYNIYEYFLKLAGLKVAPTIIVLGPSLSKWTVEFNQQRLLKLLPILTEATKLLWEGIDEEAHKEVWKQVA